MANEIKTTVSLQKEMHFIGTNSKNQSIHMDSKPLGEPTNGPTPMELVLMAAGTCTAMDTVSILRKRKMDPESLNIEVVGIRQDTHPKIFTEISLHFTAKGENLTLEELKRAIDLSLDKYCSVFGMLHKSATVKYDCTIL